MKTKYLSLLVVFLVLFSSVNSSSHPHTQNQGQGTAGPSGGTGGGNGSGADPGGQDGNGSSGSDGTGTGPDWSQVPTEGNGDTCGAPGWSVNPVNHNLYVTDTPIWHSSVLGSSLSPGISYNSMLSPTGSEVFGNNWSFHYASFLEVASNSYVTVTLGTGEKIVFKPDGNGGYLLPYKGVNVSLTKISDNHFEYRYGSGKLLVFTNYVEPLSESPPAEPVAS